MNSILSNNQRKILSLLSAEKTICEHFYLTGGTALSEFYLQHRLSEDLDFFSEEEFDPMSVSVVLRKIQHELEIIAIRSEQSFNRNLFFLELKGDTIKTEFTYFPFPRIEKKKKFGELFVDSLLDIAVNKIFTIYQKPRSRDFIDLYCILEQEKEWTLDDLASKAQVKFDHYLDPLQLGAQFLQAQVLKDYPHMSIELDEKTWQNFFVAEAEKLGAQVVE
ncbi:MAG: nucleotidyl transferase AbiEii/AbiGii toxin family protein [Candidatus Micrarchaeaceae archaeon]